MKDDTSGQIDQLISEERELQETIYDLEDRKKIFVKLSEDSEDNQRRALSQQERIEDMLMGSRIFYQLNELKEEERTCSRQLMGSLTEELEDIKKKENELRDEQQEITQQRKALDYERGEHK
ncbi:hypothetical protein I6N96_10310 [Enterococcus sp. BWM-S5]|uniref:Uncharacterized protein n=1 Tax=Enterococcus larvae TaxID=2794352 RepID=A0ABS4CJA0_9ENTE|nr:hypothetical protein [Enterococcus larvae]MBP1046682.1 hypothetical protein [Enterococcus larvae]